jgi:hypothetical protein
MTKTRRRTKATKPGLFGSAWDWVTIAWPRERVRAWLTCTPLLRMYADQYPSLDDAVSEALIGLVRADERFEQHRGAFASWARQVVANQLRAGLNGGGGAAVVRGKNGRRVRCVQLPDGWDVIPDTRASEVTDVLREAKKPKWCEQCGEIQTFDAICIGCCRGMISPCTACTRPTVNADGVCTRCLDRQRNRETARAIVAAGRGA